MLQHFPRVYPCPYCRHHMTMYVFRSLEPELYPLEWTLLGRPVRGTPSVETEVADKLATITDAASLRTFLWKLHNAVSSSIERQEEWYHRNSLALYTNRFWPSIESELSRAATLNADSILRSRLESIYGTLTPAAQLGRLQQELLVALEAKDGVRVDKVADAAAPFILQLEEALRQSVVLQGYTFNPDKGEHNPAFSAQEEEYARGGLFATL